MNIKSIKSYFLHKLEFTKVFAFVGESGSGKSFNTNKVVDKYLIDLVIDDGILIKKGRVLAGTSSKEEKTEMLAVRRAIFQDSFQAYNVRNAILNEYYPRILILGTSVKMVERICENISLPKPSKIIYIEDIATREDIEYSHKIRNEGRSHIIPLSYFEIKRYLAKKNNKKITINDNILEGKTQVSPEFGEKTKVLSTNQIKLIIKDILCKDYDFLDIYYINTRREKDMYYIDLGIKNTLNSEKKIDKIMLKWKLDDSLSSISKSLIIDKIL